MNKKRSQNRAACMLLALIFFSYALVCVLFYDLPAYRIGHESISWKRAEGMVIRSEIIHETRSVSYGKRLHDINVYRPNIEYEYVVAEQRYTSSQVYGLSDTIHSEQLSDAQKVVNRYKKGYHVEVFYKATDPSSAVLEPGINKEHESSLEFHCLVLFFTAVVFALGFFT